MYEYFFALGHPIKAWTKGVPIEESAMQQLRNVASMPFVHKHVAAMPDMHWGMGATVGSVIATKGAIIPAAVGVDIGCGMIAAKTTLDASMLPDNLHALRLHIEATIPHGRTDNGGKNDRGAWGKVPSDIGIAWARMEAIYAQIIAKHPKAKAFNSERHIGTLGTGNHFIELCLDEADAVWIMLHSGSRGPGNKIGSYFIERAKEEMRRWHIDKFLPDQDLAYLVEHTELFDDYLGAINWAQEYARINRETMLQAVVKAMRHILPSFGVSESIVNCHHNYVARENHFNVNVLVTRKGAVRARKGELGRLCFTQQKHKNNINCRRQAGFASAWMLALLVSVCFPSHDLKFGVAYVFTKPNALAPFSNEHEFGTGKESGVIKGRSISNVCNETERNIVGPSGPESASLSFLPVGYSRFWLNKGLVQAAGVFSAWEYGLSRKIFFTCRSPPLSFSVDSLRIIADPSWPKNQFYARNSLRSRNLADVGKAQRNRYAHGLMRPSQVANVGDLNSDPRPMLRLENTKIKLSSVLSFARHLRGINGQNCGDDKKKSGKSGDGIIRNLFHPAVFWLCFAFPLIAGIFFVDSSTKDAPNRIRLFALALYYSIALYILFGGPVSNLWNML